MKKINPSAYKYIAGIKIVQTPLGYLLRGQFCRTKLALSRSQYRGLGKSIAEETILQAKLSILLRRHYCKPWNEPWRRNEKWKQCALQHTNMQQVLHRCIQRVKQYCRHLYRGQKSENNTPISIQICRGYNNVANTSRISAARTVLQNKVRAHPRSQHRGLGKSIAEEIIFQA